MCLQSSQLCQDAVVNLVGCFAKSQLEQALGAFAVAVSLSLSLSLSLSTTAQTGSTSRALYKLPGAV